MKYYLHLPPLSLSDFKSSAMQKFLNVFQSPCPLVSPFTTKMVGRVVIDNEKQYVKDPLLLPLIDISKRMGESGFYFSFVELDDYEIWYPGIHHRDESFYQTWFIPYQNLKDYQRINFLTNHVIYSEQGRWGIFVSVDEFLILGGISEVIDHVITQYPNTEEATDQFIQNYKQKRDLLNYSIKWIPDLLEHVYGKQKAEILIHKHGIGKSQ